MYVKNWKFRGEVLSLWLEFEKIFFNPLSVWQCGYMACQKKYYKHASIKPRHVISYFKTTQL